MLAGTTGELAAVRRAAATLLVLALVGAAIGAGWLFAPEGGLSGGGGDRKAIRSIYETRFQTAMQCLPEGEPSAEQEVDVDVSDIAADVERLRELEFSSQPKVEFMTMDDLSEHVEELAREELDGERVAIEVRALRMIGLVPEGFAISDFIEGLAQQVLGLYDPDTKRLLVGSSEALDPLGRLTVAHELDHALTDEVLGFPKIDRDPERTDAALAQTALLEGDATLLAQHYALLELPSELRGIVEGAATPEQRRAFAELPHYVRRAITFPYEEGFLFVCDLYGRGGWRAVDKGYDSPPTTSMEILFPALYGKVEPKAPLRPRVPEDDWKFVERLAVGAADLQWMFEAPGGDLMVGRIEAAQQASRWRGGEMTIWQRGSELIVAIAIVEGAALAGGEPPSICDRLIEWYAESEPEAVFEVKGGAKAVWSGRDQGVAVDCNGNQTRFVVAPDVPTALTLADLP